MGIKLGIENIKIGGANQIALPNPDAIFDSRSSLNITDSLGGLSLSIGSFPMLYMVPSPTSDVVKYILNITGISIPTDYTNMDLWKKKTGVDSQPVALPGFSAAYLRDVGQKLITMRNPTANYDRGAPDLTKWQILGIEYQASEPRRYAVWNGVLGSGAVATANEWMNTQMYVQPAGKYCWWRGIFAFNKLLSSAEIEAIRLTGIYPTDGSAIVIMPALNLDDAPRHGQWDAISRFKGLHDGATQFWGWLDYTGSSLPATPWVDRDDDVTGAYYLWYGYTRNGTNIAPYKPDGSRNAVNEAGDIEYPASGCIHNMAESMIDFSGVTNAQVKAIFNKADRTFWNVSIESTPYYSLGAYKWHPTQLLRDFVTLHAQPNHSGHIFASVRTSGAIVTGITSLRVYVTNVP